MLLDAVATLPKNQQTAFMLSKTEGIPNDKIAEIMETSLSAVESLLFRARQNLKQILLKKI
jgi:RNA polymerase sigma-70 factor (ECF subfamily)